MELFSINYLNWFSIQIYTNIKMVKQSWLKEKRVIRVLALISFISGFLFIKNSGITGNVVVNHYQPVSTLSIVGLLLMFCSVILTIYTLKKE